MSIFERLKQSLGRPRTQYPLYADQRISHDRFGLTLEQASGEVVGRFTWSEVKSAMAFKRDLLTTDLACLEFMLETSSFEINEEVPGWQSVVDLLPDYLPGARPYVEWWPEVVQPPFQASRLTVFQRHAGYAAQQGVEPGVE